ncbi:MAG: ABC transporter permease, partial [Steroidobacteraceae bacterium]
MFKYLPLLWANLGRKKLRTGLTLGSIVVAFLLFGLMQTLRVALTGSPDLAGVDRLVTIHKIAIIQPLPISYLERIRAVPGVTLVSHSSWFGGIYQDPSKNVFQFAVEPATYM